MPVPEILLVTRHGACVAAAGRRAGVKAAPAGPLGPGMSATKTKKTTKAKATRKAAKSTRKATTAALKSIEANIEAIDGAGKKRKAKGTKQPKANKLSALDAAAQVLVESGQPMNTREMIETLAAKKLWTSPGGKTPHATLYTVVTMLPNVALDGASSKRAG